MQYRITLTNDELYTQYTQKAFPGAATIEKRPSSTVIGGVVVVAILVLLWVANKLVFGYLVTLEDTAGPILFGGFAVALLRYAYLLHRESKRVLHRTITNEIQQNEAMRAWFAGKGWLQSEDA